MEPLSFALGALTASTIALATSLATTVHHLKDANRLIEDLRAAQNLDLGLDIPRFISEEGARQ